ncbi:MAG: hypothetical protein A2Y90_04935 [Chloroflexi bacterium RBG_13_52_12]|nr:MAG: hypothetical protein A2Y90_04935 [Chloroflexi bacterium RBG_13_52_12]
MYTGMVTNWFDSSATFKKCTAEKVSFISLSLLDLILTILAMSLGLSEINPFIRFLVQIPALILMVKLFIPVLIAWFMPGKLLLPSIALLALVVVWNIREMVIFLV